MRLYLSAAFSAAIVMAVGAAEKAPGVFTTTTDAGRTVTVEFINDNIVKVTNTPAGVEAVASGAAVLERTPWHGRVAEGPRSVILGSATGVVATVGRHDGSVVITAGPDRAVSDNGQRLHHDGVTTMKLSTMGDGSYYGAGERGYSFNLAGDTLVMYNRQNYGYTAGEQRIKQMNITMPLFVSSNGYAVVFDDHAAASMVMSNPIVYTTESRTPVSYYFINGAGTIEGAVREMSALTGRQPLAPFWALGYITSKYGYRTQKEALGVIDTLKRSGYPVDGIVLDLYWYGKEQDMGRLAWDKDQWPDHRKMLSSLRKKGVNLIPISQPYVLRNGRGADNYNDLAPKGMFVKDSLGNPHEVKIWVGEGAMFDVSNPDTRCWLANRYYELTEDGVGGWWGDLGEPEVHPETGIHANGMTAREYHNRYGNDWSKIIYDMYREKYPERRLMTLMRGGTTGLQRYSVYPWSTDVSRSWGGLQPQVTIMLNSGLSGLGYMSHDVGGFAIDPEHPSDAELYVRWLQLGTFSPVLRTHSQQMAEPYKYPNHQDIILPLIRERYKWLPYNYTLAYENAAQGLPLVRPLNFYTPSSTAFDDVTDQYLWGRDVMVAPVLTQGATSRRVVFPLEGTWVDYNNPTVSFTAGDTIVYDAPLDVLPVFVRGGAFIPQADYKMENTGDYRADSYTIRYYPVKGGTSTFTMYEDDRVSASSLASNQYRLITLTGDDSDGQLRISAEARGTYAGAPAETSLTFVVNNVDAPGTVAVNGKKLAAKTVKYDTQKRELTFSVKWPNASPLSVTID